MVLLAGSGASVLAQPVASIALPDPGGVEQLYAGCNNISLTFPDATPSQTVVQAVTPAGTVETLWRFNGPLNKFEGFSPAYPQASDLMSVDFLDVVWLCGDVEPVRDPWSETCSQGTYAIYSDGDVVCESPRSCEVDADCDYLRIDKLPPRYGTCVEGTCRAFCGSGIVRECFN
jgi:hypothetical protein